MIVQSFIIAVALFSVPVDSVDAQSVRGPQMLVEDGHQHGKQAIHKLGRKEIGSFTVSVIMVGEAEAGGKVMFDVKLIDAREDPKALRAWIGDENVNDDGKKSMIKGEKTYSLEYTVPDPIPTGAKVWIEVETESGKVRGAYETETHDHKH